MSRRFASIGITVLGIILAAVPLGLWVAWTRAGFLIVLAAGVVSVVLLGALISHLPPDADGATSGNSGESRPVITNEFVEEIHGIFPLTYHHSRIEKARFRRAMDRLRAMMR